MKIKDIIDIRDLLITTILIVILIIISITSFIVGCIFGLGLLMLYSIIGWNILWLTILLSTVIYLYYNGALEYLKYLFREDDYEDDYEKEE